MERQPKGQRRKQIIEAPGNAESSGASTPLNPKKYHESCPDCGFVLTLEQRRAVVNNGGFDCARCGAHYAAEDFDNEQEEKRQAQYHNSAKADLTNESDDNEQ